MDDEFQVVENAPKPKSFTCKALVYSITLLLYGLPFLSAFIGWVWYDFFIAFCFLCFGYLVNGVIHSKMRQVSVPIDQRETSFSSYEMAKWYVARYLLCQ